MSGVKLGAYVTVKLLGKAEYRQGVLVSLNKHRALVQGQNRIYRCEPDVVVVPDRNLWGDAVGHALDVRRDLASKNLH